MPNIRQEFKVHMLNTTGIDKATQLAERFSEFLTDIEKLVPTGRPLSIVKTKIEEASFWAKRGMAEIADNHIAEPVA